MGFEPYRKWAGRARKGASSGLEGAGRTGTGAVSQSAGMNFSRAPFCGAKAPAPKGAGGETGEVGGAACRLCKSAGAKGCRLFVESRARLGLVGNEWARRLACGLSALACGCGLPGRRRARLFTCF